MAKIEQTYKDYRSLDAFLGRFEPVAAGFKWYFKDGFKLRTKIEGLECCPLHAYGYIKSGSNSENRSLPDTKTLSAAIGVHDSVASAVVHLADDILSSRYYDKAKRKRLVEMCGLTDEIVLADEEELP